MIKKFYLTHWVDINMYYNSVTIKGVSSWGNG